MKPGFTLVVVMVGIDGCGGHCHGMAVAAIWLAFAFAFASSSDGRITLVVVVIVGIVVGHCAGCQESAEVIKDKKNSPRYERAH